MTQHLLTVALDYAARYGWAVHPVNIKKIPTTEHGFYDATTDELTIREYFKNGAQLSVRTGATSGLFVLDLDEDPEKGYSVDRTLAMLVERYGELPHTPHQRTGRGGLQYFFKYQDGLRNKAGSLLGPGIDTRGEGGYVLVAPSHNTNGAYTWIVSPDDAPIADVPQWLVELMTAKKERPAPRPTAPAARNLDPYLDRAFRDEIAAVATAPDGTKHETLRDAAIKLGTLISHGLSETTIETALYNAVSGRADDPDNAWRTIQDGIAYGKLHPRTIPDRPVINSDQPSDQPSNRQVITQDPTPPRFMVATEDELQDLPPIRYLDRELGLVACAFHLIYGASGSGKTFFAIERAMRQVALGRRVLYIATEDIQGLRYRVVAWRRAHPEATGALTWLKMPEGLDLQDYNQVAELLLAVQPYAYDHIVLDTLREAHSGDENSSQDTRRINRAIQRLVTTGAAIDVVHHTGVNGERPRGSTALFGNADAVIKIEDDDGAVRISFDKIRNAPPRDSLTFGMVQQDTGLTDTDGEPVVSVILRPAGQFTRRDAKLTPIQKKVLETLALSIFSEIGAKAQQVIDTAEISRRHAYLALAVLKTRGFVTQDAKGDPYTITPAGLAQLGPQYIPQPCDLPDSALRQASDPAFVSAPQASDLSNTAPVCASDPSDLDVISSDLHSPGVHVIHSDHTRRVITGSHTDHMGTHPQTAADWTEILPDPPRSAVPDAMEAIARLRKRKE